MATQKYKQQTQQVRVITDESNYLNGMYYTDFPLAEGYVKTLINYDIDSNTGKLTPRKGLQSLGIIPPKDSSIKYLNDENGFNIIVKTKLCSASDSVDKRKINKFLQSIIYNTDTRSLLIATSDSEISENNEFILEPFNINSDSEYATPEPFIIAQPEIHGQVCLNNNFFKRPVGTFAFGNSFYTFLRRSAYKITKLADLPNEAYPGINSYEDLIASSQYADGDPGQYFKFVSGVSEGIIAYYNNDRALSIWTRSEEALQIEVFPDPNETDILCYSKLGSEIQNDEILLDSTLNKQSLDPNTYYACIVEPSKLNPTEASSWGYNMLLDDPYTFECEDTAVNLVTILGMLPYDKDGNVVLTPRKNQEITLKGYYRAPAEYHTDAQNAKFYTTTKQKITVTEDEETVTRDPKTKTELDTYVPSTDYSEYSFGDWWYCTEEEKYYMIVPDGTEVVEGATTYKRKLSFFGTSKPAASERLSGLVSETENEIRIKWQIRSSGAADWTDIYNERLKLSEYYARNGNQRVPFTITTTMPENEVLVKLTITDPNDVEESSGEEYILSTNTMGLSLVSDELANTLNLTPNKYDIGKCTGMCEWEQRLVIWGVPDALNTLFVSDVSNPSFFPYPNNVDIFSDPIIAVHNYSNELLVLTTSALYRLTWNSEGTGWTHTLIQQNLHVTEEDTFMSCVIKNMFFFKSGEYYYMMVPKITSSIVGESTIAPISKPITELLDDFHNIIYSLVKVMVDTPDLEDFTKNLVNYFSYVDNTKVVINYVYDINKTIQDKENIENSKYLYVQLIYDTDARTWSMRIFEAPHMLYASHADALQQDRFIDITPALNGNKFVLQYYKFINTSDEAIQYIAEDNTNKSTNHLIKNYQYLDTGNREINTEHKKRFREFQFKIKNNDATNLGFYTSFLIDGSLRKDLQRYEPRLLLDQTTGEAMVIVERVLDPNTMAYNTTRIERVLVPERMLQDDGELTPTIIAEETDPDRWILNQSAFPGRTFWKIRMPISGKGYTPRAILLSTNEQNFEIYGHSWVYRTMNAR